MFWSKVKRGAALILVLGLLGTGTGLLLSQSSKALPAPLEAAREGSPAQPPDDLLPEGAIYRVGSARFRIGWGVDALAFSQDGKKLLSICSGYPTRVYCWDAASGKPLREEAIYGGELLSAALSSDGKRLAMLKCGKGDLFVQVVDLTREPDPARNDAHLDLPGTAVAFTPDGRALVTADEKGFIFWWDPAAGKLLDKWKAELPECRALAFSSDGKYLASAHRDGSVRLWNRASGRVLRQLEKRGGKPTGLLTGTLAFAPNNEILADNDGDAITFWNVKTGKVLQTLSGVSSSYTLAFSPDGKLIASGKGGQVCLFETASGKEVRRLQGSPSPYFSSQCLAFSPDGKLLATGEENIRLWRVADGKEVHLPGNSGLEIDSAAFTPNGRFLATAGPEGIVRLQDATTGAEVRRFRALAPDRGSLEFLQDGKSLCLCQKRQLRLWDWTTGKEVLPIKIAPQALHVALASSGKMLAWTDREGVIHLGNAASGKELRSWKSKLNRVSSLVFSPGGRMLIAGNVTDWRMSVQLEVRETATGKELAGASTAGDPPYLERLIAISPDDGIAAWVDGGSRIHFLDTANGREIAHSDWRSAQAFRGSALHETYAAVFSPDGRTLATAMMYEPIRLWEVATGNERWCLDGQPGCIEQLAFAPDGNKLVAVGAARSAVVWQVLGRRPGGPPAELPPERFRTLWADLAGADGQAAFRAVRTLSGASASAVQMIRQKVHPVPRLDPRQVERWIADLDADTFAARENASAELEKIGVVVEARLRQALREDPSLEMRKRLEALLGKVTDRPSVVEMRVIEVLEHQATPEATQHLEALASGEPKAWLTREASAALQRLRQRPRR